MSAKNMKNQQQRIEECINIRKQLSSIGGLLNDTTRGQITQHMNEYIRNGTSFTKRFNLDKNNDIKLVLTSSEEKQSGILLERKKLL